MFFFSQTRYLLFIAFLTLETMSWNHFCSIFCALNSKTFSRRTSVFMNVISDWWTQKDFRLVIIIIVEVRWKWVPTKTRQCLWCLNLSSRTNMCFTRYMMILFFRFTYSFKINKHLQTIYVYIHIVYIRWMKPTRVAHRKLNRIE